MKDATWFSAAVLAAFLACPATVISMPAAGELPNGQFPVDPEEARALDESDLTEWADGPIQFILLEEEKEIWEELDDDEERRRFVAWFWDRRDDDLRDRLNMAKYGFYSRVAEANQRFTDLPRGWRTDRGRVWLMFGRPTTIRSDFEDENTTWNYFAPGLQQELGFNNDAGEFNVYFSRERPRSYRITGGVAPGAWPGYVLRVMELARQIMIVQPDLEWSGRAD